MASDTNPAGVINRAEALGLQARINAANFGGDNATAGADLMLAFVLHSFRSGGDPRAAIAAMAPHAIAALAEFWPEARGKQN